MNQIEEMRLNSAKIKVKRTSGKQKSSPIRTLDATTSILQNKSRIDNIRESSPEMTALQFDSSDLLPMKSMIHRLPAQKPFDQNKKMKGSQRKLGNQGVVNLHEKNQKQRIEDTQVQLGDDGLGKTSEKGDVVDARQADHNKEALKQTIAELNTKNHEKQPTHQGSRSNVFIGLKTENSRKPSSILEQLATVRPTKSLDAYREAERLSARIFKGQADGLQTSIGEMSTKSISHQRKTSKGIVDSAPISAPVVGNQVARDDVGDSTLGSKSLTPKDLQHIDEEMHMTADIDPIHVDMLMKSSDAKVESANTNAEARIMQIRGEKDFSIENDSGVLPTTKRIENKNTQGIRYGTSYKLIPEISENLDKTLQPVLQKRIMEKQKLYLLGEQEYEENVCSARQESFSKIENLKQEAEDKKARHNVQTNNLIEEEHRKGRIELVHINNAYRVKADKENRKTQQEIKKAREKAETQASRHLDEAEKKADLVKQRSNIAIDQEKQKDQEEKKDTDGVWGWVKNKAGKMVGGLKNLLNDIYDQLRREVKAIFDAAKKLAIAVIELGRMVITGLIKAQAEVLKLLVNAALAAFPKKAAEINNKIDGLIGNAVETIRSMTDDLKKSVEGVIDFLAEKLDKLLNWVQSLHNDIFNMIGMIITGEFKEIAQRIGYLVEAAKQMPSHLVSAVWNELLGSNEEDQSNPVMKDVPDQSQNAAATTTKGDNLMLGENDIVVEPVITEICDPQLISDLDLDEGEERVIGENQRGGVASDTLLSNQQQAASDQNQEIYQIESKQKSVQPEIGERAGMMWEQVKKFLWEWLKDNWGKLLLGTIAALAGITAIIFFSGGAILPALLVIAKVLSAVFIGMAVVKVMGYLKTYLNEGWNKRITEASKALASAVALGLVEIIMLLGFRVIGAAAKGAQKVAYIAAKSAMKGAKAAAAGAKSVFKSSVKLASKIGTYTMRGGKLVFRGMKRGFSKGIKKASHLANRLIAKLKIKRIIVRRRGRFIDVYGVINPRFLIMTIDGEVFEEVVKGSKKAKKKLHRKYPGAKIRKIGDDTDFIKEARQLDDVGKVKNATTTTGKTLAPKATPKLKPGQKIGGSEKPISPTVKHPTKKKALDAAQAETAKGRAPVKHKAKKGKPPHYHPVDSKGELKSKHHDY